MGLLILTTVIEKVKLKTAEDTDLNILLLYPTNKECHDWDLCSVGSSLLVLNVCLLPTSILLGREVWCLAEC